MVARGWGERFSSSELSWIVRQYPVLEKEKEGVGGGGETDLVFENRRGLEMADKLPRAL